MTAHRAHERWTRELAKLLQLELLPWSVMKWRLPPIETEPHIIAFAQTYFGKLLLLAVFGYLLVPFSTGALPITLAAAACAFAGQYRRWVVTVATLAMLCYAPNWFVMRAPRLIAERNGIEDEVNTAWLRWAMLVLFFILSAAAVYCVRRFRYLAPARWPVLSAVCLYVALVLIASFGFLRGVSLVYLWGFISVFGVYFWFLSYALLNQKAKEPIPFLVHLGAFHPFWGGTSTPWGKGASHLEKVEAKTSHDLAVTQLKGLKVIAWAWVLKATQIGFIWVVHKRLALPEFASAMDHHMMGMAFSRMASWGSLITFFFEDLLTFAAYGHATIACARMAGYRLLRNTCRPLRSRTIAEFWNRYYYYFKEMLVEVFFYPTYLRYFKSYPRVRTVFATFMAASVGNVLYHFIVHQVSNVADLGVVATVIGFQTYAFYSLALAAGISVSQVWPRDPKAEAGWLRGRLVPGLRVCGFFCVLQVFSDTRPTYTLGDHFAFLFYLLGIDQWT